MSDDRHAQARDGHLDDEATLDAVDGVLDPGGRAHLAACGACRAEVAAQVAVRDALAAPPPAVDPAVREAAIATALDAWTPEAAVPGPLGTDELAAHRRRRRPAPSYGWLGAAAVILLLVVALPLLALAGGGGDDTDMSTAAGGDASEAAGGVEERATALAGPGPVDVGDLGDLAPGEDLRPVVDAALGRADADADGAAPDDPAAAAGPAGEAGPAEDDAAPEEAADEGADGAGAEDEAVGGPCVGPVREAMPDLGALVVVGTAAVEGEAVRVLGFEAATAARPSVVVVVVAEATCEVVTFQSHARG